MMIGLVGAVLAGCASGGAGSISAKGVTADQQLSSIRRDNGLSPLSSDSKLEAAAKQQARLMAGSGRMAHTASASNTFAKRVDQNGIEGRAAENIAHGRFTANQVIQVWMNSPPHRRNMLNPAFSRYGLASAKDPRSERLFWAMVLGE